jgi:hypothetical protein
VRLVVHRQQRAVSGPLREADNPAPLHTARRASQQAGQVESKRMAAEMIFRRYPFCLVLGRRPTCYFKPASRILAMVVQNKGGVAYLLLGGL